MLEAKRIKEVGGRDATRLTNDLVRAVIDDQGGMVPEFSLRRENGYLNTHWIPHFRSTSGKPFDPAVHTDFRGDGLLYDIAGNFPCLPGFGRPGKAYGVAIDAHATTAHSLWRYEKSGELAGRAVYSVASLTGDDLTDLSYRKFDLLLADHPVHYTVLKVRNSGSRSYRINAAWHNTIAPPFLESGCLIDISADRYATIPSPSDFDDTGRLQPGREFDDITKAPLRSGKSIDARIVPGMIGYTDFITGSVPLEARLGWSSVVNPSLGAVYLCFFKGPKAAGAEDIQLPFNDLWMQYGGRRFTPWAASEGGTDWTFCLGTENSVGAYANGLEYSIAHPTLLDRPTTVEIPAAGRCVLSYGTLAARYSDRILHGGVSRIEASSERIDLIGIGHGEAQGFAADPDFSSVEKLVEELE